MRMANRGSAEAPLNWTALHIGWGRFGNGWSTFGDAGFGPVSTIKPAS